MQTIGRYELRERLGRGGFGTVYRAHDPTLGRDVAIKLFPAPTASEDTWHEARMLAKFSHPNIVKIFDVGQDGDDFYVVMELVDGDTGHEFVGAWTSWQQALEVYEDAGIGLAVAHDAGLVHGDFKPANVLLGFDGRICVGDFGLATLREDAKQFAGGTLEYMAPELLLGRPVDPHSDQWSFCVSLWETLHGRRPFAGRNPVEMLTAIDRGPERPDSAPAIPPEVEAVLRVGLAVEIDRRYPSMWALLDELRRVREPAVIDRAPPQRGAFFVAMVLGGGAMLGALATVGAGRCLAEDHLAVPVVEIVEDPVVGRVLELIEAGEFDDANRLWEGEVMRRQAMAISTREDSLRIARAFAAQAEHLDGEAAVSAAVRAQLWTQIAATN